MSRSFGFSWPRRGLAVVCSLVLLAVTLELTLPSGGADAALPIGTPAGYSVTGIDVSSYNGPVDWRVVKADGVSFAFVRASEQADKPDANFLTNYLDAKAQGLFVGAYHRAKPDASSGKAQADYFLDHAQFSNDGTTLPPVVDMEWPRLGWTGPHGEPLSSCYNMTPAQMVAWTRAFLAEVATRTGRLGAVYTSASWWNLCTNSDTRFGQNPLWVARYGTSPLPLPTGWAGFTFWQYTSTGRLSNGQVVDQDVFSGDAAALASLAKGTPTALSSWVDAKYQHLVHLSADGHVHELYAGLSGSRWAGNDLTTLARAPAASPESELSSWVDAKYQHVAYVTADGHVRELYFRLSGGMWAGNDLTTLAGAQPAVPGSALTSWVDAKYQHITYVSMDGHVHELYFRLSGGNWADNDLTTAARTPTALLNTALSSWVSSTAQHVVYLSTDDHVRELYFRFAGGAWRESDLTTAAGAPLALLGSTLTSWATPAYQHAGYFAVDGHVHELYFRFAGTRWSEKDLHASAGGG